MEAVTSGVDAIRQMLLGSEQAMAGLGVTVRGHTMAVGQEMIIIGSLGTVHLAAACGASPESSRNERTNLQPTEEVSR